MFCVVFFSDFLSKSICCGYSFELHRQVDAVQMRMHNICFYKEVDKKYTGCNLKTTELLNCALIGACMAIRWNTLYNFDLLKPPFCIVKLGFTRVYIIFLISAQKHRLWVLPRRGSSNEYPQSLF